MAQIDYYISAGSDFNINTGGSGLGFYGNGGFGYSVAVGAYQDNTYVTDGNGVVQGPQGHNVKYLSAYSGIVDTAASGISLRAIPNYQASVNPRFTHASAVKVQNTFAYIYNRTTITSGAVGVTTKLAELCHPYTVQVANGSGDSTWYSIPANTSVAVPLADSPGMSGWFAMSGYGSTHTDTRHDWYLVISASPDTVGSKTEYGLSVRTEYV
jgi:hypothetical protein